jgi:ABC-type Mn2+/Zn2+ transport system permease subunit
LNARWHVARLLISLLFFAVVFTQYFQPRADIPPATTLEVILSVELAGILLGNMLAPTSSTKALFQTLIIAAGLSAFLVYFLKPLPALTFDQAFIDILVVEFVGLLVSGVLVRQRGKGSINV